MIDLMVSAKRLRDAAREVEEQSVLVQRLGQDVEVSRAAHVQASIKLRELRGAEDDAYRAFCGRDGSQYQPRQTIDQSDVQTQLQKATRYLRGENGGYINPIATESYE